MERSRDTLFTIEMPPLNPERVVERVPERDWVLFEQRNETTRGTGRAG
jgi:hypothetical protein